jgi:glycosyltransferase involved in cell wall biosynthesis
MSHSSRRKRVLLVAFHFPPDGGSGTQRTLKFAQYLPELGWDVEVLTVSKSTYEVLDPSMLEQIPQQVCVHRTFCLNLAKHLSILGWYPGIFNFLDRFVFWLPFGVWRGWALLRQRRFDVLYSTSPTRTAHLIGWMLARLIGVPWVTDFRDPWLDVASQEQLNRKLGGRLRVMLLRALEYSILRTASRVIVNTSASHMALVHRYPEFAPGRFKVVTNGYDEADFTGVTPALKTTPEGCLVILHSGEIYPDLRDPRPLIEALESLVNCGKIGFNEVCIRFIGSGSALESEGFRMWLALRSVKHMVSVEPRLGHRLCVAELLSANVLLVLQCASRVNMQIPAKFYEYLRSRIPILTIAPAGSATARMSTECGIEWVVDAGDSSGLRTALLEMVELYRAGALKSNRPPCEKFERRHLTMRLAEIFEECCQPGPMKARERVPAFLSSE